MATATENRTCRNCGAPMTEPDDMQPAEEGGWECRGGIASCYGEHPDALDFDLAEAIGLDGTLRDDERTHYTWANLTDAETLRAVAYASMLDYVRTLTTDDIEETRQAIYAAADARFTPEGMERLTEWATGTHASPDDLTDLARDEPGRLLAVIAGENPLYGHCDTCGSVCDAEGCVTARWHVAALP